MNHYPQRNSRIDAFKARALPSSELVQRHSEEAARVETLIRDATAWREAEDIRGYIAVICAADGKPRPEVLANHEGVREQANRLDPVGWQSR